MRAVALIKIVVTTACWALAAVLIVLRLAGVVQWSWWWITAPVWTPFVAVIVFLAGFALFERVRPPK